MQDVSAYIDAICAVFDNDAYAPVYDNGKLVRTFCNFAVNEVAIKMGCNDLIDPSTKLPRDADGMADYLLNAPNWLEIAVANLTNDQMTIQFAAIQEYANAGRLTVAVAKSIDLKQAHGHICVIRPGLLKSSGKWGDVPSVLNIGGENFIALGKSGMMKGHAVGINEAFQPLPRFYVWKG